jgi:hypothetical protein
MNHHRIEAPVKYVLQTRKEMKVVFLTPEYLFGFKEVDCFGIIVQLYKQFVSLYPTIFWISF